MSPLRYGVLATLTIAVGLLVHYGGGVLGPSARDVLGDALWASMMFWLISAAAPGSRAWTRAAIAVAVCFGVEFSQLYRAPALDAWRATVPGHLILGSGFDPRDLLAYTAGVALSAVLDRAAATNNS